MNVRCWTIPILALLAVSSGAAAAALGNIAVDGRVADPEGQAVAGASVEIRPAASLYEEGVWEADGTGEPPPAAAAVSGKDGRFTLMAPQAGMWTVTVRATDHVAMRTTLSPLLEAETLPDAVLAPDAGLRVRVEDADGKPLPGSRVRAAARKVLDQGMPSRWEPLPRGGVTGADGEARLARAADEALLVWAVAAGHGVTEAPATMDAAVTLRLHRDPPRRITVHAAAGAPVPGVIFRDGRSGLVLGRLLPGWTETDLTAGAGATIRVETADGRRMSLAGNPATDLHLPAPALRGGRVIALLAAERRPLDGAWIWPAAEPALAVRSDAHGAYRLEGSALAAGLQAAAPGFLPASRANVWNTANELPSLGLSPASFLAGTVVDETGRPVSGALVTVAGMPRFSYAPGSEAARVWTSSAGAFRVAGLCGNADCRVEVRHPDFAPLAGILDGLPREVKDLRLVLRRGATVTGTLVDEHGEPPAGPLDVELVRSPPDDGDVLRRATVSPDGRFALAHLPAGQTVLHVRRAGAAQFHRSGVRIPETGTADLGRLVLPAGETLTVRVTDPAGRPLPGAVVSI
ncbi:MAG TPA: carboxypeptidase-like regulatory domain-containing protein, partial [Thermoanaerobaculia bacterium]